MAVDAGAFGERLRACRAAVGLSQEELAGRSGVSVRAIGDMERGRTRWPHRDSTGRLADALGLADRDREEFLGLARRPVAGFAEPGLVTVPYRGLSAFGEQDAGLFFGREEAAARVLDVMSAGLGASGLVVVSGVSGAGKSSLLRAGVLPQLRQVGLAAAPEAAWWPCLVFAPGRSPLEELAVRIAPLARADAAALREQLAACPAGFALTARQAALAAPAGSADGGQRRVVLVVDQFEQVFSMCPVPGERQAFITALHAAATTDSTGRCPAAVVVLAVRADFEARLADFPQLSAAVQDRYLLTAMTRRQLRMAITQPAAIAASSIEENLVRVLLDEVPARRRGGAGGAGALPLLSHVLDQAWRTRAGNAVTLADYQRAGGIKGAVAASAQRAYRALGPAQQEVARQVFTRLTAVGPDGTDTAVPAARADLTAGGRAAEVEAVLERFAAERLLILDAGTAQISHEVLLAAWPLLRDDWLADARADRVTRTRLHATVTEWVQAGRDPSYLYSGSRLEAAAAAAARIGADPRQLPLSAADTDFLHASHRAGRRSARTRQQLTAVLLALVAALATVSVAAVRAAHTAAVQRDIAVSSLLISQSQALDGTSPAKARIESLAAYALNPSPQARYAMLQSAANPQAATKITDLAGATTVAFSPDGKTLAVGSAYAARLWDLATGRPDGKPLPAASTGTGSVAFSPDAKTLATATEDGTVQLWDVATGRPDGKPLRRPTSGPFPALHGGHPATQVSWVAFSPDGKTLATAADDTVQLWDAATGRQTGMFRAAGDLVDAVAFSLDGETLATVSEGGTVQLWEVATGQQIGRFFAGGGDRVDAVAFSPDGSTLATASADGAVRLWDVITGRQARWLAAVGSDVSQMAFSPDGSTLATSGGLDGTVQLWDVATGRQAGVTLTNGNSQQVSSMAFSPDGKTLATADQSGARLWDVTTAPFGQLRAWPATPAAMSVAFSPDSSTLATSGGPDGKVRLWDVATGRQTRTPLAVGRSDLMEAFGPDGKTLLTIGGGGVLSWDITTGRQSAMNPVLPQDTVILAFSPDGKTLAAASPDGAQLWDMATGQQISSLPTRIANARTYPAVAFSPDGKTLAAASPDGTVRLWDVATGQQIGSRLAISGGRVYSVAFSPDRKTLATASPDGAELWDVTAGQQFGSLLTSFADDQAVSVAFSPDGKTLATASPDGAQLWDMATGQQIGGPLDDSSSAPVNLLAFSPDGKTLATASLDGTVLLWNVGYLTNVQAQLCAQAGGALTIADWATYVPAGTPYRNACPRVGTR